MFKRVLASARDFGFSDTAIKVLIDRFLRKDRKGYVVETPEGMFRRASKTIADIDREFGASEEAVEKFTQEIYDNYTARNYMASRPLENGGRPYPYQQLSSCYVFPLEDNMDAIFQTLHRLAFLQKWGSPAGVDYSVLRPRGDLIRSTGGKMSGPVSFMKIFDAVTAAISEGATRRGANMGVLRVDHPDIEEFITAKQTPGVLENFNISVGITDDFMEHARKNQQFSLINPRTNEVTRKVNAKKLFALIVDSMWRSAEPGLIFLDEINRKNPTPQVGKITAVNLCGEQPLLPYESCNLCNINLQNMLTDAVAGKNPKIDWPKLKRTVESAVHFLDNSIEANHYFFKEIEDIVKHGNRKIGVGVMGWADVLFTLGIPYDSAEGFALGEKVMKFINETGHAASVRLGKERGAFPNFTGSIYDKPGAQPIRNASVTTVAPTGNMSIVAGCSPAVEPNYALAYTRVGLGRGKSFGEWDRFQFVNETVASVLKKKKLLSPKVKKELIATGSIQGLTEIPPDLKAIYKTALDIAPQDHVKMQAVFQKHCDSAISKTINMKESATKADVEKVVWLAWRTKCKGLTIYRDKSREKQVLTSGIKEPEKK